MAHPSIRVTLKASVPLRLPLPFVRDFTDHQQAVVDELHGMSGELSYASQFGSRVKISIAATQEPRPELIPSGLSEELGARLLETHFVLHFTARANVRLLESEEGGIDLDKAQLRPVAESVASEEFANTLSRLLLCACLAKPGAVYTDEAAVWANQVAHGTVPAFYGSLEAAVRTARELKWPTLDTVAIPDIWAWAAQLPGFADGMPQGRIGRAIAGLSHLVVTETSAGLVWALIGLEALYCRGVGNLKRQLMEKSEVLLGPRREFKRRFDKMYDFRSRLVHGDVNLPLLFSTFSTTEHQQYDHELYEAESIASAMLLATVHEMVRRRWYDLNYGYSLIEPLSEPLGDSGLA
jgi:hypothetical protein